MYTVVQHISIDFILKHTTFGPEPATTSCLTKTITMLLSGYFTVTSIARRLNFCVTYQRCVER